MHKSLVISVYHTEKGVVKVTDKLVSKLSGMCWTLLERGDTQDVWKIADSFRPGAPGYIVIMKRTPAVY